MTDGINYFVVYLATLSVYQCRRQHDWWRMMSWKGFGRERLEPRWGVCLEWIRKMRYNVPNSGTKITVSYGVTAWNHSKLPTLFKKNVLRTAYPEDKGSRSLRNGGKYLKARTASHPRRRLTFSGKYIDGL